jgi:serine/threonine protein phosphatase 1
MTGNWKSVARFNRNGNGRDFVCGDIHGCFSDLEEELEIIGFDKTADRLFCVGDLIDRGPNPELAEFYIRQNWFFTVLGNHEHMFFMANVENPGQDGYRHDHIRNGGIWAYKNLSDEKRFALMKAVDGLPLIIQIEDVIIAHAALPAVRRLSYIEKNPFEYIEMILWHRDEYPALLSPGVSRVYVGHSIVKEPSRRGQVINIDTGAFLKYRKLKGKLTVLEM